MIDTDGTPVPNRYDSTPQVKYENSSPKQIDWEERRYDIAKEVSASYMLAYQMNQINKSPQMKTDISAASMACWSIKYADELIKQLKKDL